MPTYRLTIPKSSPCAPPHVPLDGRNLIRARLEEVGANFQWHEVNGQHAFLRDEGPREDLDIGKCPFYSDVYRRLAMRSGIDG
jgi:hypothetical protein